MACTHEIATTSFAVVPLPDRVVESVLTPSCDAEKIVLQLKENLQPSQVDFEQPCSETRVMIRSLARKAIASNRRDVFHHLRKITPAGTTGPLLAENLQVREIPDSIGRKLTMNLSGRDDWKLLAEALRLTPGEVQFFDQRTLNPVLEVLVYVSKQRSLSVGELYDLLNENGFHALADFL
ncbi:uncharacterized protein LOC111320782 [Stylophora pistillata]|uniref:uncharacterized protein LOC111320782 n=1 Tax=Stylophora pistillata TaxID=50429 RepID=UPI000C03AC71|nr:uncharacterized protein LOC111320782 [Stylophora pistillata]